MNKRQNQSTTFVQKAKRRDGIVMQVHAEVSGKPRLRIGVWLIKLGVWLSRVHVRVWIEQEQGNAKTK